MVTLYSLITLVLLATCLDASLSAPVLVSSKVTNFISSVLASCMSFVSQSSRSFAALVCFLFIYLAGSNLLGNVPFSYSLATSIPVSLGSSVALWVWLLILTLSLLGLSTLGQFIPAGTPLMLTPVLAPIESVSYSARAISLGVRLFSNILAGHTLLAILANFLYNGFMGEKIASLIALIAIIPLCCIIGLEIAVSLIQGYVFSVLLVSYIDGAI